MICEPPSDRRNLHKPTTFPANKHYIDRSRHEALWPSAVSQTVTNENEDSTVISLQTLLTKHHTLLAQITTKAEKITSKLHRVSKKGRHQTPGRNSVIS